MDYRLQRSSRKTLAVCVSDGEIIVKAPNRTSIAHIEEFLAEKALWIAKKVREHNAKTAALAPVTNGTSALYHGMLLPIVPTTTAKACINGNILYLPVKYDTQEKRDRAIANLYKKLAQAELADKLYRISASTRLSYSGFALTNARTQWGNCDGKCSIRLNWRLVMLDDELVTYVIVHELCHTAFHDHSSQFWALVQKFLPNYKAIKKRLKNFSVLTTMYR
ncbi:MAG: M48 family metallopeptidase [Clostridiales bacterium]|nr:M48 family metallopeptidase [Clostridiales bacterium]